MLEKNKLNDFEVFISKALIDSNISHDNFFSVKNLLREWNEIKEEIKNQETSAEYTDRRWTSRRTKKTTKHNFYT